MEAVNNDASVSTNQLPSGGHPKELKKVSHVAESVFVAPYPKTSFTAKLVRSIATKAVGAKALTKDGIMAILKGTESFLRLFLKRVEGVCRRDDEWCGFPVGQRVREVDVAELLRAVEPLYARDEARDDDCRFEFLERVFRESLDMQMHKRRQEDAIMHRQMEQVQHQALQQFFLGIRLPQNVSGSQQAAGQNSQSQPGQDQLTSPLHAPSMKVKDTAPKDDTHASPTVKSVVIPPRALSFHRDFQKALTKMHLYQYHALRSALDEFRCSHEARPYKKEGEAAGDNDEEGKENPGGKRRRISVSSDSKQKLWNDMQAELLGRLVRNQRLYEKEALESYEHDLQEETSHVDETMGRDEKEAFVHRFMNEFNQVRLASAQATCEARWLQMEKERDEWLGKPREHREGQ